MDNFTFGTCKRCNKAKALKNNLCSECEKIENLKNDMPDFFKDLFDGVNKKKE